MFNYQRVLGNENLLLFEGKNGHVTDEFLFGQCPCLVFGVLGYRVFIVHKKDGPRSNYIDEDQVRMNQNWVTQR